MVKLNKQGYLAVEVILASVVAVSIAVFLIDLTVKMVNKTNDNYTNTLFLTDKALITNNLRKEIKQDIIQNGKSNINNIGEIENLDEIDFSEIPGEEETQNFEDVLNGEELINSLIENKNLILEHAETSAAYYSPKFDKVVLPKKKYFLSSQKYYATTFHEIIHWTGHESRLNRLKGDSFGDDGYQFEELVAEIGSILINFELGILDEFINSLRYLKSWTEVGNKNQEERIKELQEAFNLSKKAVKYIKEN